LKKGEEDEKNLEETIQKLGFKIGIMEERADRFEMMAFDKYEEMDKRLTEDIRLKALNNK